MFITAASPAPACGPSFPNSFLDHGDSAVLAAPVADFSGELERMKLPSTKWVAKPPTNTFAEQTMEADIDDLRLALKRQKLATKEKDGILKAHRAERQKLLTYLDKFNTWRNESTDIWENGEWKQRDKGPPPEMEPLLEVQGVPKEFSEYLRASAAYAHNQTSDARLIWQGILAMPAEDRHFHSTWAEYMLGRTSAPDDFDQAREHYQHVRALAREGFADSLGLAEASLGWEAQANLKQKHYAEAIQLYLEQAAAGRQDSVSLSQTARAALEPGATDLIALARNPLTRRVLTAYVISGEKRRSDMWGTTNSMVALWLDANERAEVREVESAEQLALAAYQDGEMEIAQRWIDRARKSPATQWLQAKLFLHDGKVDKAAALLARLSHQLPLNPPPTGSTSRPTLADNLSMDFAGCSPDQCSMPNQILGELGVIHLSRNECMESLDALLRSGYWLDAAYVAERVMTVDELKAYVDHFWPAVAIPKVEKPAVAKDADDIDAPEVVANQTGQNLPPPEKTRSQIRYLLGRRLTRLCRGNEARAYYPAEWLQDYDELMKKLNTGWDETQPQEVRAAALFEAAKIARHSGMELLGTEAGPDWHYVDGQFEFDLTAEYRSTNTEAFAILKPAETELQLYKKHNADPEERFHYRYQAAFIAMEAANLLPNNTDQTALILCTAGSWLKARDPKTADIFYKKLVRRCRKTPLGAEADRIRWFPDLDDNGNWVPGNLPPPQPQNPVAVEPPPLPPAEEPQDLGQPPVPDQPNQ